jgi:hypothetical protein
MYLVIKTHSSVATQHQSSSSRGLRIFYAWLHSRSDSEEYFAELANHRFTPGSLMRQKGSHSDRHNAINTKTSESKGWSILTYREDSPLSSKLAGNTNPDISYLFMPMLLDFHSRLVTWMLVRGSSIVEMMGYEHEHSRKAVHS